MGNQLVHEFNNHIDSVVLVAITPYWFVARNDWTNHCVWCFRGAVIARRTRLNDVHMQFCLVPELRLVKLYKPSGTISLIFMSCALSFICFTHIQDDGDEKAQHWTARKHSLVQDPYHKTESLFYAAQQHWATDWFLVCQSGESEYKPVSVQREYKQKNAGLGLFLRMANYVRQHQMRPALWICTNLWKDMDKTWRTKSDTVTE